MAQIFGKDKYLKDQTDYYSSSGLLYICVLLLAIFVFWLNAFIFHFSTVLMLVEELLLFSIFFLLKKPIENSLKSMRTYMKGRRGEERVRDILKTLPEAYSVFEGVVIPPLASNIDFVVIGPTGIFTIEVKSHKGSITYDGHQLLHDDMSFEEGDILRQAKGEVIRLSDYFKANDIKFSKIQSILVFSNKFAIVRFGKRQIENVQVIGADWLLDMIQNNTNNVALTTNQIESIQNLLMKTIS